MANADLTSPIESDPLSLPEEVWKPVVGFEDCYEVSSLGRVKSKSRRVNTWYGGRVKAEFIMRTPIGNNGYQKVGLQRNRSVKSVSVHTLVLEAFVGLPGPSQEARHLNGDRVDNRLCNLAWGNKLENMRDQYIHGTRIRGATHHKSKLTPEIIEFVKTSPLNGAELSRRLNLGTATICRIRKGKSKATLLGEAPSA